MAGDAAPGFAEEKPANMVAIAFEGAHHVEDGVAGRRQNATHDHVPDLALRMAADDGDLTRRSHAPSLVSVSKVMDLIPRSPLRKQRPSKELLRIATATPPAPPGSSFEAPFGAPQDDRGGFLKQTHKERPG